MDDSLLIHRVIYEEAFKPINYFDTTQDAAICKFTTKSAEWLYEAEYRSINDKQGKLPISMDALIGITFGAKCSNEDILYLVKLVNEVGYSNITWRKASMQRDSFNLRIEPLRLEEL